MNWPEDAQNWMDVLDHVLVIAGAIALAAVPTIFSARTHKSIKTETKVIRDQLVNGHNAPMREDLDRAIAAIESLAHDVQGLRRDLAAEEDRRRVQISELRDDLDRRRKRL